VYQRIQFFLKVTKVRVTIQLVLQAVRELVGKTRFDEPVHTLKIIDVTVIARFFEESSMAVDG